jgi:hypothetical protein
MLVHQKELDVLFFIRLEVEDGTKHLDRPRKVMVGAFLMRKIRVRRNRRSEAERNYPHHF